MTSEASTVEASAPEPRLLVARVSNNRAAWIFGGVLALAATGLFSALEARRSSKISSPATAIPSGPSQGVIAPPPDISIPAGYADYGAQPFYPAGPAGLVAQPAPPVPPRAPARQTTNYSPPAPTYAPPSPMPGPPQPPSPAFAYRAPPQPAPGPLRDGEAGTGGTVGKERVEASRFVNPATTVPQGTIIQAVMETALDSNRAGFARAVISRDVMSFDGSRILIPRGSRLFGEYKSDLSLGQNRALIQWRRLTRPDGGIIDLDSPSADPLGRAGVKGKVNSHFFARFGGAILQSALDIGTGIATRSVSGDNYYIGLPNATQGLVQQRPEQVKPTLTLKQGSSVSVFVARDLDFTAVE